MLSTLPHLDPCYKVKREISVLRCLAGGPHIVELIDTCSIKGGVHVLSLVSDSGQGDGSLDGGSSKQRQAAPNTYCLVLEHCGSSRVLEEAGHAPDLRRRRPAVGASAPTPSSPGESGGGGCGTQGVGALPSWLKPWGAAGSATEVAAAAAAPAESASASARATTRRVRRTAPLPEQEGLLKQQEQQQEQQQQQRGEGGGRWGARVRQLPARRLSHGDFPKWRPLTTSEVRWAVFQLLEALKFAHGMSPLGVMHRDVKPSNVLVAGRGVPGLTLTLVDFGLAEFHRPVIVTLDSELVARWLVGWLVVFFALNLMSNVLSLKSEKRNYGVYSRIHIDSATNGSDALLIPSKQFSVNKKI